MAIINLLSDTNPDKSIDQNSASLINMYITKEGDAGKYEINAYPTPGLTTLATLVSPVRALYEEHGVLYAVGGNKFYSITSGGTATILGTLNTSTGVVKIRGINDQLLILDGGNGYVWKITAATFSTISDANFINTATDCAAQDEFGITINGGNQTWYASAISDLTTWPALSFASVTGYQANLVAVATLHREVFLFQTNTIEVWDNLGTANFTFGRNQSVFIEWGCAAKSSVAKGDNTLFFLGQSPTGGIQVIRLDGYSPMVISNPAINYQLSTYTTVSDAIGFVYQQEGHEFYVLTLPTAGVTWVYDVTTKAWHQRQSLVGASQTRWLPSCYAFCYNTPYVGDYNSGNVYSLDMTNNQENGSAITRTLVTHPFYTAGTWIYCDRLQIDLDMNNTTAGNTMNLTVSRDGGRTFGSAKSNNMAGAGATVGGTRIWWSRLGAAKGFVFKLTTTMNAKFLILGAWANMRGGDF